MRISDWAADCERLVVSGPRGKHGPRPVLDLDPDRFVCAPNGFDPGFAPRKVDRRAHWRRHLVEQPQGWRPGAGPGSVVHEEADLEPLDGTVLLYFGPLHRGQAPAAADRGLRAGPPGLPTSTALVLLGGYPGEWEGEHPVETIERLGLADVFLAGWHSHEELPDFINAADLLVHASVKEQFGQVLVEAMACGLPVIAIDRDGPATIVDDPETGWLLPPTTSRRWPRRWWRRSTTPPEDERAAAELARRSSTATPGSGSASTSPSWRATCCAFRARRSALEEVQGTSLPGREGPCRKS